MRKFIAVLCLSMVFVLAAAPRPSMAGTKTLLPDQFTLATWGVPLAAMEPFVRRNSYWLGSSTGGVVAYESKFSLPVGARITKVTVNAKAVQPVEVWVGRAKLGNPEQNVAIFTANGDRGWYEATVINYARVDPGYSYWVHLDIAGNDSFVYGLKISYR